MSGAALDRFCETTFEILDGVRPDMAGLTATHTGILLV